MASRAVEGEGEGEEEGEGKGNLANAPEDSHKHCQGEELEAGQSCKINYQDIMDKCGIEISEKRRRRWSTKESCLDFYFIILLHEDESLIQMINIYGHNNWETVARAIPGRNAQQCRVRWKFNLDPAISKQAWSREEELRLIHVQQIFGNKWCRMAEHFTGRTSAAIKEHWRDLRPSLKSKEGVSSKCDGSSGDNQLLSDLRASLKSKGASSKCDGSSGDNQLLSDLRASLKSKGASSKCDGSSDENKLLSDLRACLKSKQGASSKCDGSSGENQLLSDLQASLMSKQRTSSKYKQGASSKSKQGTSSKSKQGFIDLCENTDTSEGESSELICTERPDPDSGEASQRIRDRLNWRKRARKKLVFLSSPVELKVSAVAESERHLQESKEMSPEVNIVSPPAVLQGFSPEVPSVCEKIVEPPLADFNQAKNVCSLETSSDPCTLEQHLANVSDLLDMSYIDGLMIIPPAGCPYDGDFI
uniref:Myb-like domain-containing protein n=1 Tax=Oryza nivara TaxID=4536 RepID=A0A0E0G4T0_ORYNI